MIEVEIKARINDFIKIKENLRKLGAEFIGQSKQKDIIFGNKKFLDAENKMIEGGIVVRIRQDEDKTHSQAVRLCLEFKETQRKSGGLELKCPIHNIEQVKDRQVRKY